MALAQGVDRALGRNPPVAVQPPDQQLADLARVPMRLVALEADDQALDLRRQLIGVAHWPARAVAERLEPVPPVPTWIVPVQAVGA